SRSAITPRTRACWRLSPDSLSSAVRDAVPLVCGVVSSSYPRPSGISATTSSAQRLSATTGRPRITGMLRSLDGLTRHIDAGEHARRSRDRHRVVTLALLDRDDPRIRRDFRYERFNQTAAIHGASSVMSDRARDATEVPRPRYPHRVLQCARPLSTKF